LVHVWKDVNNKKGVDFDLFSSLSDALFNTPAWTHCNYNDYNNVGFPRDCGPRGLVGSQWNGLYAAQRNYRFSIVWIEKDYRVERGYCRRKSDKQYDAFDGVAEK